jgi:geranylgeranyl transferase type-2 subunit beta
MSESIEFLRDKHINYIRKVSSDVSSFEYLVSQHLRMSGVYWGLTSLVLLGLDLKQEVFPENIVEWIFTCYDPVSGG